MGDPSEASGWLICSAILVVTTCSFLILALYIAAWAAIIYALIVLGRLWLLEEPSVWNILAFIFIFFSLLKGSYSEYDYSMRRKPYEKVKTYYVTRTRSVREKEPEAQAEPPRDA